MRKAMLAGYIVLMVTVCATVAISGQPAVEQSGWTHPEQRLDDENIGPRALIEECKTTVETIQRAVGCYVRTISTVATAIVKAAVAIVLNVITVVFRLVVTVVTAVAGTLLGALFG